MVIPYLTKNNRVCESTHFNFKVIKTGSKGNSVILNDKFMFDFHLNTKEIKDLPNTIKYIFITHEHGDHIHVAGLKRYLKQNPHVKLVIGSDARKKHIEPIMDNFIDGQVKLLFDGAKETIDGYTITGRQGYHGEHFVDGKLSPIQVFGYHIEYNGFNGMYTTDNQDFSKFEHDDYEIIMIESNYNDTLIIEKIDELIEEQDSIYDKMNEDGITEDEYRVLQREYYHLNGRIKRFNSSYNHSSCANTLEFLQKTANEDTLIFYLHTSNELFGGVDYQINDNILDILKEPKEVE